MSIELEEIVPTSKQIESLFNQLKSRNYSISHETVPSFKQHAQFVRNNPYRAWFLILKEGVPVANVYVQNDNSVGINNDDSLNDEELSLLLQLLFNRLKPLEPIPSLRYKNFFFNVPVSNTPLQQRLEKLGFQASQISYIVA